MSGVDASSNLGDNTIHRVLIVDNDPGWRDHVGRVVQETFEGSQIHYAANAQEALNIIANIDAIGDHTKSRIDLVLTDLHMANTPGKGNNGDHLLMELMRQGDRLQNASGGEVSSSPSVAVVSGTFLRPYKHDLAESMPDLVFLNKEAFLPMMDDSRARGLLVHNLRSLVRGDIGKLTATPDRIALLDEMQSTLADVAQIDIFIDSVQAKAGQIWAEYGALLSEMEGIDFFKRQDLYDRDKSGHKLHDFKNSLTLLIDKVHGRGDSQGLVDKLISLQIYINSLWGELSEKSGKINAIAAAKDICARFSHLVNVQGQKRIGYTAFGDVSEIEVDKVHFHSILSGAITNALAHSQPGHLIKIEIFKGAISISNISARALSFSIYNNELADGELPESSTIASGSGKGLKLMLEMAQKSGIKISMDRGSGGLVITTIDFGDLMARERSSAHSEEAEAEAKQIEASGDGEVSKEYESPPADVVADSETGRTNAETAVLSDVVFLCHDGTPDATFRGLINTKLPGINYRTIPELPNFNMAYSPDPDLRATFQASWEDFFRNNHEALSKAFLCVVHMAKETDVEGMLGPIHARYPQLNFLPASSIADHLKVDTKGAAIPAGLMKNILTPASIASSLSLTESGREGWRSRLYTKEYSPDDWQTLVKIAQAKAFQTQRKNR